jgi:acyl-CoA synthetase (AMP-forming)/AMP-acid ligase II
MLLWAKAAARRVKDEARAAEAAEIAAGLGLSSIRPEQLDQARIEDLVAANLSAKLDILHPDDLAQVTRDSSALSTQRQYLPFILGCFTVGCTACVCSAADTRQTLHACSHKAACAPLAVALPPS